ncbi:MAG: TonB family protein [Microscillaceae bacterium]|jgi:protein TonB|nr:TonB family protein [Microscillaceae bacterium]
MVLKKRPDLEINYNRNLFLTVGIIISMLFVIGIMEFRFKDQLEVVTLSDFMDNSVAEEVYVPPTQQEPPPAVIQQPEIVEVPDEQEIIQNVEMDLDANMNQEIKVTAPIIVSNEAQAGPVVEEEKEEIFMIVEEQPSFEGGLEAFYKFVGENMVFPKEARRAGVDGKVFTEFIVDKEGKLTDIKIIKGIGFGCDDEAIRVLKESPKWKAGKQRGRNVKVRMSLPIYFKLVR